MKKIDRFMETIDRFIDRKFGWCFPFIRRYFVLFSSTFLLLLLFAFFFKMYYHRPLFTASVMKGDIQLIHDALSKVDQKCNILSINGNKVILDFFTVKRFAGSLVGGVNLAYPRKWKGPYIRYNPSIQQKFYELVHAQDGYFIIPGDGVKLPNNLVMGKDIIITKETKVMPMLEEGGKLSFNGILLARPVGFKIGDWDPVVRVKKEMRQKMNSMLQEFNAAFPFAANSEQPVEEVVRT